VTSPFAPRLLRDVSVRPVEPQAVVETFLAALAAFDFATAADLLDDDVVYVNVGLPTLTGRRRSIGMLKRMAVPHSAFEVYLHAVAANGNVVLTDRTDVLTFGRLRVQFWVAGHFEVHEGRITLWRDSFDYIDCTRALLRGLMGALIPALRPAAPSSARTQPGRH
jgi:limonene-1,2-epoxide hydrolase